MEHDQGPAIRNAGANHAKKIVETPPTASTMPTMSSAASTVLPPSVAAAVAKNIHGVANVGFPKVIANKNEEIDKKSIPSKPVDESSSLLPPTQSQPLSVSATATASRQDFLPPASQVPNKSLELSRTVEAGGGGSSNGSTLKHTPFSPTPPKAPPALALQQSSSFPKASTSPSSTSPSPIVTDEQNVQDEKLKQQRKPLTDKYGSYICATDTSLEDARLRLHTAMEQTRRLRQAFTDRVYKKYRVCLEPIPTTQESFTQVLNHPEATLMQLEQHIHQLSEEKTAEKREAASLNTEMTQAPEREKVERIANAENAEQLMYISAGLSLIVLPEDETADVSKWYADRAPTHPSTGQRVKGISAAAATAGEVMLDRKRKGALLRKERLNQQKARGGNIPDYSRLQLLANNPTFPVAMPPQPATASTVDSAGKVGKATTSITGNDTATTTVGAAEEGMTAAAKAGSARKLPSKSVAGAAGVASAAKAIRARVQATMSVQTLLSLSPTGEELRTDGKLSAATLALMECGIGTLTSKSHPRYRHPYPESAGGRRRALHGGSSAAAAKESAGFAWSLPALPTAKERRSRKRLQAPALVGTCTRAKEAIQQVLRSFDDHRTGKRRKLSEISFLHGIQDFGRKPPVIPAANSSTAKPRSSSPKMDPTLAFHVMRAVGLIQSAESEKESLVIFPRNLDNSMFPIAEKRAMGDEGGVSRQSISKLRACHEKFLSRKDTFSDCLLRSSTEGRTSVGEVQMPVASIRGGGEALKTIAVDNEDEGKGQSNDSDGNATPKPVGTIKSSNSAACKSSVPVQRTNQVHANSPQANRWDDQSRLVLMNPGVSPDTQPVTRLGQYTNVDRFYPNAVQLANQLRLSRIPNSGSRAQNDFSEYIGSLHPQAASGYDWSAVNAASAAAAASAQSLAVLRITPHRSSLVNIPLQDRSRAMLHDPSAAAAAHAAATHHQQQALVYLSGGYQNTRGQLFQPNMGATMMNPVYMNQPGMQTIQMNQQQHLSRSQPRGQQKRSEGKANTDVSTKEDTKQNDLTPELLPNGSVAKNPKASSSGIKRKASHGDRLATELSMRDKVVSTGGESVRGRKTPNTDSTSAAVVSKSAITNDITSVAKGTISTSRSASAEKTTSVSESVALTPPSKTPSTAQPASGKGLKTPSGLHFFVPPAPIDLPTEVACKILDAKCHEAADDVNSLGRSEKSAAVAYLVAVGTAVPIPKALVANFFKEKLNASPLKSTSLSGLPQSSRDAGVATILLWLWKSHEFCFQRAFAKSGRIDVEPECKWLLSAVVDKAISSLGQAMDDPTSRTTTPLAIALMAIKSKTSIQKGSQDKDSGNFVTTSLDLLVVSAISKGLSTGFLLSQQIDASLPSFNDLLDYLDELRKSALYSKSQERALLAALISRKATMSLSFSHAYVSAMVRAGEALGHGELFEVIQNEEVNVSTMIPYDVFTDESGAWEDPCRPPNGFNPNLTGDDLMRQAHARAMIQKSLRKLQERHNIKGGTLISGAYIDPPAPISASDVKAAGSSASSNARGLLKRRPSFAEKPVQAGTGSAAATSWLLYEPKHSCAPLDWSPESVENAPYGNHDTTTVPRSLSVSQFSLKASSRSRGPNTGTAQMLTSETIEDPETDEGPVKRSTREIPWVAVADIFQNVNLPGTPKHSDMAITPRGRTIFAPTIRQVTLNDLDVDSVEESDEDEDFSDDVVLARHQEVLDNMKEHLSAFFAAREKSSQERRGRKSSKT